MNTKFFSNLFSFTGSSWTDEPENTVKVGSKTNIPKDEWSHRWSNDLPEECTSSVSEYSSSPLSDINLFGEIPKTLADLGFEAREKCSNIDFDKRGYTCDGKKRKEEGYSPFSFWSWGFGSEDAKMEETCIPLDERKVNNPVNKDKFEIDQATVASVKRPCSEHVRLKLRAHLLKRQAAKTVTSDFGEMRQFKSNKSFLLGFKNQRKRKRHYTTV